MHHSSKHVLLTLLAAMALSAHTATAQETEIGSTLNTKSAVAIADVPASVMAVAKARRPDLTFQRAEHVLRNNTEYFDIEGVNPKGQEVELDMILEGGVWRVVEIQRDVDWGDVPAAVQQALTEKQPGVSPDRIIESDQDNGMIIYEFFTRDADGKEEKYEVALKDGAARYLTEEWAH